MNVIRVVVAAIVLHAGLSHADPASDREQAKKLWLEAVAEYDLGRFDSAIAKYQEAYRLMPNANILNNLAQAYRQKKDYEQAIAHFRSYLRNRPQAANRAEVLDLIDELEQIVAAQKISNQRPPDTIEPPPASAPSVTVVEAPPPPSPAPLPATHERSWARDPIGWSLVGGGAIAAGVGVALLVRAAAQSETADGTLDQEEAYDRHASARRTRVAGGIVLGVGTALIAGGVLEWALAGRTREAGPRLTVGVGPGAGSLVVMGAF